MPDRIWIPPGTRVADQSAQIPHDDTCGCALYLKASTVNARIAELERERDAWKALADAPWRAYYLMQPVDVPKWLVQYQAALAATPLPPKEGSGT